MFSKKELETLLGLGLETGADFSEIFLEDTYSGRITVNNGDVISAGGGVTLISIPLRKSTSSCTFSWLGTSCTR